MTAYKLSSFVGEAPSVSDRALGANFARESINLFLPSGEFWPLATDRRHSACVTGTKTLHRFSRDASGAVVQNPDAPIRSYAQELCFVKGQINDEASERTYRSTADGSERPRMIDTRGNDRVLGVARPVKPTVKLQVVGEFTADEARTWLYGDFAEMVRKDLLASAVQHAGNQEAIRWDGSGKAYAGATSNYGLALSTSVGGGVPPANLYAVVSDARVGDTQLTTTRLGATKVAGGWAVPVTAMPASFPIRRGDLVAALQLHEFPATAGARAGETVLSADRADKIAGFAVAATAPGAECANCRAELDRLVKEFAGLALTKSWSNPGAAPVKPAEPRGPQYVGGDGDSTLVHRIAGVEAVPGGAGGVLHRTRRLPGRQDGRDGPERELQRTARRDQQRCSALVANIQAQLVSQYTAVTETPAAAGDWLDKLRGVAEIAGKTVQRVVDSRYYVVSFVSDLGEESEPSPLSDMLEADANDTVTINRPATMTGESHGARNIAKWRLYRSNTSETAAAWQLVQELLISVPSFLDDKPSEELDSLQPQFTWTAPSYWMDSQFEGENKPTAGANPYLRGLTGMPNGIMAGFIDNTVAFCEPYVPYAWPVDYQVTTEFPVVGLAVFDRPCSSAPRATRIS